MSHRDIICGELGEANRPTRRVIFGPILASVAFVLELTLVPLLIPVIQQQFGLSIGELVWVFNSYGLAVAIGVLMGGWFGDAFGIRRIFVAGAVCFALGSLLVALAGSFEALLLGRTLQGFGGGIFSPLIPLLLIRASPNRPGRVLIVWGSVTGYVAAIAPLIYGQLLARHSWDLAFGILGLLALGATLLLNGAQSDENDRSQHSSFKDYSQLLLSRNLWMMFGYVFCTYGAITFHLFRLPVLLTTNALDATWIGLAISIIWLSFAALSTFLRNKVDKTHIHKIMLAAPILIAVGLPLSYFAEARLALLLSSVLVGAGLACSNAPSTQMVLKFAPKGMGAISASLDITFARLGGVATVAILAHANSILVTTAIGIMCLFAFLCAFVSSRPQPPRTVMQ